MPLIRAPRIPDRVRAGYEAYCSNDRPVEAAYSEGYQDAVRDIMGDASWFAMRCDLDGNPMPTLFELLADTAKGATNA